MRGAKQAQTLQAAGKRNDPPKALKQARNQRVLAYFGATENAVLTAGPSTTLRSVEMSSLSGQSQQ